MKVYVAPCGIGLGHVSRTAALANELNERGVDTLFSTYLDGIDYVRKMGFKLKEAKPIAFKVRINGSVDFKQTATRSGFSLGIHRFLKQVVREIQNIGSYGPDVIFSDSRASTIIAAKLLRKPVVLLLNQFRIDIVRSSSGYQTITDRIFFVIANFFWVFVRTLISGIWTRSDYILIPDYSPPYTISIKNLAIPKRYRKKVKLIGPLVSTKPDEVPDVSTIKRDFGLEIAKPIVYAAISGPKIERFYLINKLSKILQLLPDRYQMILSKGDPNLKEQSRKRGNLIEYGWIDDLRQFMLLKASDVIIGRAGHGIITKALVYGKPLILIPIPDQTEQSGNASRAKKLGVAKVIAQIELNENILLESIDEIINSKAYPKNSEELSKVTLEMDGIRTATNIIVKVAHFRAR